MTSCLLENMRIVKDNALTELKSLVGLLAEFKPHFQLVWVDLKSRREIHWGSWTDWFLNYNQRRLTLIWENQLNSQRTREWVIRSSPSISLLRGSLMVGSKDLKDSLYCDPSLAHHSQLWAVANPPLTAQPQQPVFTAFGFSSFVLSRPIISSPTVGWMPTVWSKISFVTPHFIAIATP